MSRIGSIHPGIWTDVEFVGLSAFARLLYIGIWNECDDKGIFLWSPLHLKMRILPADNVDAAALLTEVEAAGRIIRFTVDGKDFGAVKNFAKFQRPKKPNDIPPATPEILAFAGHASAETPDVPEEVPNQLPTGGEKSPQMEDGGCNKREPKGSRPSGDERPDAVTPEMIVGAWNELAKRTGLPTIRSLTKQRKQQIAARLREYPNIDDWADALAAIERSPFLLGLEGRSGWRASFDFLLQPSSFAKLIEGTYDRKPPE